MLTQLGDDVHPVLWSVHSFTRIVVSTLALGCTLLVAGCSRPPAPAPAAVALPAGDAAWALPAAGPAQSPSLHVTPTGRVLLAWIGVPPGRRPALQFAAMDAGGQWEGPARTIVVGQALSRDWGDAPHLETARDGALWAQWVQAAADGGRQVVLSRSADGGVHWAPPVPAALVRAPGEHGFASLWPQGEDGMGVAWIGPRAAGAASALVASVFNAQLQRVRESTVDPEVCECCRTAVALAAGGARLFYRDEDDGVRDVAVARMRGPGWDAPMPVHRDGWKTPACPVNGPAAAAAGGDIGVAWFTAAGGRQRLLAARSGDGGLHFDAPVELAAGAQLIGRVAVAQDPRQAWFAWLQQEAGVQSLWLARRARGAARPGPATRIATLSTRGHAAGYPQLAVRDGAAYLAWTDVEAGQPVLRGLRHVPPRR